MKAEKRLLKLWISMFLQKFKVAESCEYPNEIKIGITTGSVEQRINQLYTTSVPYRFRVIKQTDTKNYAELEQSLHKILDPFRINRSREYFTDKCLPYIDSLLTIHEEIQKNA